MESWFGERFGDVNVLSQFPVVKQAMKDLSLALKNSRARGYFGLNILKDPEYSDSHEVFLGAGLSVFLSPGLTLYYDVDDGDGLYAEAALSLPFSIGIEFSLDGSLGYNAGQWGYKSSMTVFGLSLSTTISLGNLDITPLIFGQAALDEQYKTTDNRSFDGYGSLGVTYEF